MNRRELLKGAGGLSLAALAPLKAQSFLNPSAEPAKGVSQLNAFDYRGVRLLPGMFEKRMQEARELYFNMPTDDMLKGFRREADLPDPGQDMTGWARRDCGATFGQWISGLARLSCALDDTPMRQKAITLVEEWEKTLGADGNCRMGTYAFEKMTCGLTDVALYAGYDRALEIQARITQWAMQRFDRSRSPANPMDRDGRRPHGTLEWYTLPENSYRAYLASGNPLFKQFADLWRYESYWNKFEDSFSPEGVAYLHSYSHVNTFCGPAMEYAVTGDPRLLQIVRNAYDFVTRTQAYATGGYGPGEWSVPPDGILGSALEIRTDSAEIPCGSWAGFKLSRYLLGFTGEARYGEWLETLLYNGIGAALPVKPDGTSFYYADYRLNTATKLYHWDQWPCCSGTYIQTIADFHNIIYFRNADGLFVNLIVPSEATWNHNGQTVTVRQETEFPNSGLTTLTLQIAQPTSFGLHIRIPSWAKGVQFRVNEEPIAVNVRPSTWAAIVRTWKAGDKLSIEFEMPLYTVAVDAQHPNRAAIKYGPVLLSQFAEFTYPLELDHQGLDSRFTRIGDKLHFRVSDISPHAQSTGDFRPFYEVEERTPYRVYFDLYAPRIL